ncbi:MAG: PQQ-like beta-propeller repeat protein, partial [Planctomycetaceae bacterium]|nr:PQQ-like beta-propeller repeat protein [Planctomycetaceae bacterium]
MRRIFVTFIVFFVVLVLGWRVCGVFAAGLFVAQNEGVQVDAVDNKDTDTEKNTDTDKDKSNSVDKEKDINPYFTQLVSPDRSIERQIEQMERLIKVDRHADVVRIIGSLLENSDSVLIPPPYQPRNNGENNTTLDATPDERTTNITFTKRLLEIFQKLPDKAKETYNIQYKTQADSLLESAIKQGSFETLQKVAQKYLFTDAGVTALFLVGMYQLELGDWESALLTFDKVNYIADQFNFKRESFEPALSLSIAACQIRLDRETEAAQTLDKFLTKFPRPRILTNGKETQSPTNSAELFSYVKESIANRDPNAVIDWLEHTGWLLPRGVPSQNPETAASSPLLETVWEVPNFNQDIVASLIKKLYTLVQSAAETYIHALQPLVVGNFVITRGVEDVTAVDIDTGKRVWHQSDNDYQISPYLMQVFQSSGTSSLLFNLNFNQGSLRTRIWHDRIANSMSSDGERLFYISEHNQRLAMRNRNLPPLIVNNKAVENPLAKRANTLIARDAKTGNLLWRAGKFNFVQKSFDKLESEINDSKKRIGTNPNPQGVWQIMPNNEALNRRRIDDTKPDTTNKTDDKEKNKDKDTPLFSDEELLLSETLFLGAPLPLHGRLYCICESEGLVQLLVLSSGDGKLLSKIPLAQVSSQAERGGHLRYLYGLTPSAANGIIFCPTGLGMVFAIDATTVTPLWCFSYEQTPTQEDTQNPNRRQLRINMIGIDPNATNNEYYRQLFEQAGWQVPSIMIDGSRVLIAPPDLPVLYCVDSLTGKLLWQVTNLNWQNTLYIACIHNKIAYIVTPISVLALSMDSGQQVWEQVLASQTTPTNNSSLNDGVIFNAGNRNLRVQIQINPNPNPIQIPVPIPAIIPNRPQFNQTETESAANNNNDN